MEEISFDVMDSVGGGYESRACGSQHLHAVETTGKISNLTNMVRDAVFVPF